MANITLDGRRIETAPGATILEAARATGADIPTLCHHEALDPCGACRLCIVEASGPELKPSLMTSCNTRAADGMVVETESPRVVNARRKSFELLAARSPHSKLLMRLAARLGVEPARFKPAVPADGDNERDDCLRCGICIRACTRKIGVSAIVFAGHGEDRHVAAKFEKPSSPCIGCGACANLCPTGAIRMADEDGRRRVFVNGRMISDLPLVKCGNCGRFFTTFRQADYVKLRLPEGLRPSPGDLCPECLRISKAAALSGFLP
ncbi:MAG: 2Fe-2S iron-sulfur cluster-binding protein [Nitrospiraceae bacterium]|nr:2Fe-2S iron-sulfur cluster-binding protein [Nitrospiraceae bacterium]